MKRASARVQLALGVAACLGLALALRLWGITFAATAPRARPDEETFIVKAFDRFGGDNALDILRSGWPEGFFRVVQFLQWLQASILTVAWKHPVNLACVYAVNPGAVQLWPRVFSAIIDTAGCLLVGLTARRLARKDEKDIALTVGILALGCNYLAVRNAHFGVSDSTLLFTICLCLYAAVRAVLDGPRFLPVVAIAAATGFGIKYAAAPLVIPCLLAFVSCWIRFHQRWRTLLYGLLALLVGLAAFHLTTPGALGNFQVFWQAMVAQSGRYTEATRVLLLDQTWPIPPGWAFHLFWNLPVAFGWPALVLSLLGLGLCARRDPHAGILLIATSAATFAMLAGIRALFVRYAAPLLPTLTVGLAVLLAFVFEEARRRLPRAGALAAGAALALAAFAPPLWSIVHFDHLLSTTDTRDLATRWLQDHGGGPAITEGWYAQVQLLDPASLEACKPEVPPWLWQDAPQLPLTSRSWKGAVEAGEKAWGPIAHTAIDQYVHASPGREAARYVVSGKGQLPCGKVARSDERVPVSGPCYVLATVISPGVLACDSRMDMFDAMWIPYQGFEGQQNPGPRIEIYENSCFQPR